ncbi:MAG: c-type cytochrome [Planctomycetota bacterium]
MSLPKADRIALVVVAVAAAAGLGLTLTKPYYAPDAEPIYTLDTEEQEVLFNLIGSEFGAFTQPMVDISWYDGPFADLDYGRKVYAVNCLHCHGGDGGADTPTAALLTPPPRNFSLGAATHQSTPIGRPPLRSDLRRTVLEGVPSTSMSEFSALSEEDRHAAVDYVYYLMIRGAVWNRALSLLGTHTPAEAFVAAMDIEKERWTNPMGEEVQ